MEVERTWEERALPVTIFKHSAPKPHGGVGAGQTFNKFGISVPISVGDRVHNYKADMFSGAHEHVPALVGIPAMTTLNAAIFLQGGKFYYSTMPGEAFISMPPGPGLIILPSCNKSLHPMMPYQGFQNKAGTFSFAPLKVSAL